MSPRFAIASMWAAMTIFGSNFVISRYGTQHGLTPDDLVALRYGVAGPLLLPYGEPGSGFWASSEPSSTLL